MELAAKANDANTPNWNEAMNGTNAKGFWKACEKELSTLNSMKVLDVVDREEGLDEGHANNLGSEDQKVPIGPCAETQKQILCSRRPRRRRDTLLGNLCTSSELDYSQAHADTFSSARTSNPSS